MSNVRRRETQNMLKLYRLSESKKEYWETWEDRDTTHTVHWGELGTKGESKTLQSTRSNPATAVIQKEIDALIASGFSTIDPDDHAILLIEYAVDGFGTPDDLEKRHRLEDRMNETLGWTGLGACDGGSIGSGTMEVCCYVVDFELAKRVVAEDLAGSEFEDFTRIYDEGAEWARRLTLPSRGPAPASRVGPLMSNVRRFDETLRASHRSPCSLCD